MFTTTIQLSINGMLRDFEIKVTQDDYNGFDYDVFLKSDYIKNKRRKLSEDFKLKYHNIFMGKIEDELHKYYKELFYSMM